MKEYYIALLVYTKRKDLNTLVVISPTESMILIFCNLSGSKRFSGIVYQW